MHDRWCLMVVHGGRRAVQGIWQASGVEWHGRWHVVTIRWHSVVGGMAWCGVTCLGLACLVGEWHGMAWLVGEWHLMAWLGMAWYGMAWHGRMWHGMAWQDVAWHSSVHGTQYGTSTGMACRRIIWHGAWQSVAYCYFYKTSGLAIWSSLLASSCSEQQNLDGFKWEKQL
eukprot:366261-Chlamydomonas_euryale.AAC.10